MPVAPTAPLQIYFVKAVFTSLASKTPLLLVSNPTSTFVPPVAQLTPAGSVVVFTKVFFPSTPLVPAAPAVVESHWACVPVYPFCTAIS